MDNYLEQHEQDCLKEGGKNLTPWEQHATVIHMPRFDYHAPSAILQRSHSGFLITCTIKREKSATKEAINILQKYFDLSTCASRDNLGSADASRILKRSKTEQTSEEMAEEHGVDLVENAESRWHRKTAEEEEFPSCTPTSNALDELESEVDCSASAASYHSEPNLIPEIGQASKQSSFLTGHIPEGKRLNSGDADVNEPFKKTVMLSLVKLARNGIIFFSLPGNHVPDIVGVLAKIFQAMELGEIKRPLWCHRILPVQATCLLKEDALHNAVLKLVKEHIGNIKLEAEKPLKFAVGYNRRGVEGHEVSSASSRKTAAVESSVLGRTECLQVVAGAVKEVMTHSTVDLRSPEMAVLVEVLPLAGIHGSCVAAVSVLPGDLVNAKPRLCVKPFVSVSTANKKKQLQE